MPTIPFSAIANIVPGVISAGGAAVDLSALALSESIYAPQNEVLGFPSYADVSAYFGSASPEALAATARTTLPPSST